MASTLSDYQDLLTFCQTKIATTNQSFTISRARVQAALDAATLAIAQLSANSDGSLSFDNPDNSENNGLL